MDRDCKNCVYHSSGSCSQWDCNFTTTNDVRNKAIDDFVKVVKNIIGISEIEMRMNLFMAPLTRLQSS